MRKCDVRKKMLRGLKSIDLLDEAYSVEEAINEVLWYLIDAYKRIDELEGMLDKKMAKVTKQMKTAERDVKKGKPMAAVQALKGAEKKNVKLTKIDRDVRDPQIKEYKAMKKKGC